MAILEVSNVTKRFKGLVAVNDVSLNIHEGEILGLVGPNGAGKSTFFNCICGFHTPTEGDVLFRGEEITGWKPEDICKSGIARTFQIVQPFGNLSLLENVMGGFLYTGSVMPGKPGNLPLNSLILSDSGKRQTSVCGT